MIRAALFLLVALLPAPARAGWAAPDAALDGVWRSQGYGWLMLRERGAATLYHVAGDDCYRDPDPAAAAAEPFALAERVSAERVAFAVAPDQTRYVFDRIPALPRACLEDRPRTPAAVARLVAATFAELYPGFGRRGRDEAAFVAALSRVPADAGEPALLDRLAPLLTALDDAHVALSAGTVEVASGEAPTILAVRADPTLGSDPAARERAWGRAYRAGIVAMLDGGGHQAANRRILWGTVGGVGYLNVLTMGGFADGDGDEAAALDAALDEALTAFRDLPGVIVDVGNNRGGYDALALRIAARFAAVPVLAYDKQAVGAAVAPQRVRVEPSPRVRYAGPVTLLTSDVTVSAGEVFTLAMRALPTVRHRGTRTRGALSDQLDKPLPNGWTLSLPAERYRDADGRSAEGIGIAPEEPLPQLMRDHVATVRAVAAQMARTAPRQAAGGGGS